SSRRVPTPFRSSGRTVRGEEFVTLPRLHPDSQCPRSAGRIKRSAGPYCRVLTFGRPPERREGSGRPAHRRAALKSVNSHGLPTTELRQPYCLSPGGQCAPEPQQRRKKS
ncbi:unnamed protein product, partial [Staurois parvus]